MKRIVLYLGCTLIGGCAFFSPEPKAVTVKSPDWVSKGSWIDKEANAVYGVGLASGFADPEGGLARRTADNQARAQVAKVIRIHIERSESGTQKSIKALSAVTLSGVQVVGGWYHPNGDVYALAILQGPQVTALLASLPDPVLHTSEKVAPIKESLASTAPKGDSLLELPWVATPGRNLKMLKTEVTVNQYKKCVYAGKCTRAKRGEYYNWDKSGRGSHPINGVTWFQARDFCKWAEGRLPTKDEWDHAATSGGKEHDYPWGNDEPTCDLAVFDDRKTTSSEGSGTKGCGKTRTWPVCSKPGGNTEQGLCDMAGNVWEWTGDSYRSDKKYLSLRGGSWYGDADYLRASYRFSTIPAKTYVVYGFRCAQ
jgi:formylglycine-generating enzyme required for sulfatase activity